MEGLRTEEETVMKVVALLSYGCPLQAIVFAFGLDERTVAAWQKRAGAHCRRVHIAVVEQGKVKSQHIQADEIRAKGRKLVIWIALAMDVTTRLWMAGAVSQQRDHCLIDRLFQHVRACCPLVQGLLVSTDGFAAYPKSIVRAFREKVKKQAGRGRCALEAWPDLCIATVIKHTKKKRVVEITRKVARGTREKAKELLLMIKGCAEFNTQVGYPTTPAMAATLTDHIWSIRELLWYKVAPAPWVQAPPAKLKRSRGRSRKPAEVEQTQPKRPRGRPPKYVLAEGLAAARTAGAFTN